ncbi:interferon-induced protein 44 isoform X2 [Magallana gigas]|uniref:interferon-induced protein 44 isoform X2 n=1 Tax=Magallana gigas TaxID=29159 RepID=UPI00333E24D8
MPDLLSKKYRDQLVTWIGRPCHFQLVYKISRDGCSAPTFHQKCDGQGATVTVLYNTNNTEYGGYLSQSWNSNCAYINDPNAFLFRLQYNGSSNPLKFPVTGTGNAGYGHSNYGPTFGGGHDIYTFSGTVSPSGKAFSLNGGLINLGHSYNLNGQNVNTIANNSLQVTDLVVYKVIDGPGQTVPDLDKPWREHDGWTNETMQALKESLLDYKPMTETNVTAANILLIGQIGAGKSSFFNSVNSIFRGKITSKACSGSFEHSVTTMFNPLVPFTPDTLGYIKDPNLKDKIHCVAFVIDGSTVDVMSDKVQKRMKDLQVRMNHRGLPQVVFLTKLDKICPDVNDDVKNTFTSTAVCDAVEKVAEIMGLPRAHVLPVKNYESETKLKTTVDILLMQALQRCLDFADDYMDEQLDKMAAEGKNVQSKD